MRNSAGTLLGTQAWAPMNVGGLGYVTGMDWSCLFCRTDVGGAYRRSSASLPWTQIISSSHMTIPAPASLLSLGEDMGCFAIASAKSDSTIVYMAFRGRMLRSANSGVDWTDDSLNGSTGLYMNANGGNQRTMQHKLEVDPTNSAVVYLGTQKNGLWRRLSGVWAQIADIPTASVADDGEKAVLIGIDNSSALTGSGATSRRSIVYASSSANGIYKSTDGGTTFSQIASPTTFTAIGTASCTTTSGSPAITTASTTGLSVGMSITGTGVPAGATVISVGTGTFSISANATASATNTLTVYAVFKLKHLMCDAAGTLWACHDNGLEQNLWKYTGSWTNIPLSSGGQPFRTIEQDPKDATRYVGIVGGGYPWISRNSLSTFNHWQAPFEDAVATSVPIIGSVLNTTFNASLTASAATVVPHPVLTKDYIAMGLGVCYIDTWPVSNSTVIVWNEDSAGIEELVAHSILITPNGHTVMGSHDKAWIAQVASGFPAASFPAVALCEGYCADYAIDNYDYIAVLGNRGGTEGSGISTDGGLNFAQFASFPWTGDGGSLACGNAGNIVVFPGQNYRPYYTTDGGVSWTVPTFTGFTLPANGTESGWGFGTISTRRFIVCADKDNAGTFYAYNYGCPSDGASGANSKGLWKSTNSGATWARVNTTSIINSLFSGFHVKLRMNRGILYLSPGESGSSFDGDPSNISYRSEDGGVTWTALGQIYEINSYGIGAPAPGLSVHTLYALGWKLGVFGLYRSIDKGVTWTLMLNNTNFDRATCLAADPTVFGRIVVGYTGTGYAEGNYSYALRLRGS